MIDLLFYFGRPALGLLSPENAHTLTVKALASGMVPCACKVTSERLKTRVFGLDFPNPLGLAAGFDKNAETMTPMLDMGLGFVEAGTVTPKPQSGNPKPRVFRLEEDKAVINRLGFNNEGLERFAMRMEKQTSRPGIVGANIGANKDSDDRIADYVTGFTRLYGLADYFTVNISSPNTPGLRGLQDKEHLEQLLQRLTAVRTQKVETGRKTVPILLKVAPDLTDGEKEDIASVVLASGIDGMIVSNTTIDRDMIDHPLKAEVGGLSGAPLFEKSTQALSDFYQLTAGKLPLVGVGGISSGADAYEKIRHGASLVQLYSALTYDGPPLIRKILKDLDKRLKADGFSSIGDAVGCAHT